MTVSEIMIQLGMSQSMVSRQLSVLRSVGVVVGERRGDEIVYCLTNEKIGEVCDLVRAVLVEQTHKQSIALSDL